MPDMPFDENCLRVDLPDGENGGDGDGVVSDDGDGYGGDGDGDDDGVGHDLRIPVAAKDHQ